MTWKKQNLNFGISTVSTISCIILVFDQNNIQSVCSPLYKWKLWKAGG